MKHETHESHPHAHAAGCGHPAVRHDEHVDFLHEGHLHRVHDDHVDECRIEVGDANPTACTSGHACSAHGGTHRHGSGCSHQAVPHGDHLDYLVGGHLHHAHDGHCDDHGRLPAA